jgi:positive regulator of sigma E activity
MPAAAVANPAQVKRPPRWECNVEVVVQDDCGRELFGRLANLSEGGFMAECEEKVRLGSIVEVRIPDRGLVRAEVRWVLGWRFGAMILADSAGR